MSTYLINFLRSHSRYWETGESTKDTKVLSKFLLCLKRLDLLERRLLDKSTIAKFKARRRLNEEN